MRTVEWQNVGFSFEEESCSSTEGTSRDREKMSEENDKQAYQMKKFQDPSKDLKRQHILALTESFGTLLANNIPEKIAIDLLTEDFEGFVFSSTGRTPVQHNTRPQGFVDLWAGKTILERNVRVTDVDFEKSTAWQICDYKIMYKENNDPVVEVSCEIFTIKENRIGKYRASFGCPVPSMSEFERFLMPSRKDKMLAKVKEINYALAGQPDFEKIASLFNENTEYRIWSWDDHKCFTFYKHDFPFSFEDLQENMQIRTVVPYELSVDSQQKFISGTYVYYLEERFSGKKYVWLSTCVYGFDLEVNLTKISQQGELYPEEEADIPFELYSRDALVNMSSEFAKSFDQEYNPFYNDSMLYDCRFYAFMPESFPNPGYYQGLKHIDKLELIMKIMKTIEFAPLDVVDVFVDHYNESHETVLVLSYVEGRYKHSNEEESGISITIFNFENGKLAKQLDFISRISFPIPSPFDDKTFQSKTIQLP